MNPQSWFMISTFIPLPTFEEECIYSLDWTTRLEHWTRPAFQPKWFDKWPWLHYDRTGDRVFCFLCVTALKTGKIKPDGNIDKA